MHNKNNTLRNSVFASLFAALMVIGVYIRIPVGPVPIVLTNFFVLLSGLLLGSKWGLASVGIYLFLGAIGLPVFSSGGGIALFAGPTGGYLTAYLPAVFLTGIISGIGKNTIIKEITALITATFVIYLIGTSWLKFITGLNWHEAIAAGVIPFLIGDGIKIAAAVIVTRSLYKTVPDLFPMFKKRVSPDESA